MVVTAVRTTKTRAADHGPKDLSLRIGKFNHGRITRLARLRGEPAMAYLPIGVQQAGLRRSVIQ